jgi:hypothetical protein
MEAPEVRYTKSGDVADLKGVPGEWRLYRVDG